MKRPAGALLLLAAALWLAGTLAPAADTPARAGAVAIDFAAAGQVAASAPPPAGPAEAAPDPDLVLKDQANYFEYVRWLRDYSRRGWEWHLMSTQALFAIVLGIVGFGLWITWQQFKRDYTGRRQASRRSGGAKAAADAAADGAAAPAAVTLPAAPPPPPPLTDAPRLAGTIKIGPAGLELTSQIIGLLVLAMSIAFFYFYVKEVYPMRELVRETGVTPPPAPAPAPPPARPGSAPR